MIEAGIAGTPIVATEVGGMPEMARHLESALFVPRGDIGALAASITSLLTNLDLAGRLAENSRLRAMTRTPATMADEVLQVLESAAGMTQRPVATNP
jgi:glycosyltransferase involved in cell wall biosynthesis